MKVFVNREEENLTAEKVSISDLLTIKDVEMPEMVSVQLNGNILKREKFDTTFVEENDQIEFLYFMGGGACQALKERR